MYQYKIKTIKKIVDGDTIDVEIDLGFNLVITQRIRLKGINAPETKTINEEEKTRGLAAKEWLKKELLVDGEWIIETTKEDKYGRMLGTLYLKGNSVSINQKMLNEKMAVPFM